MHHYIVCVHVCNEEKLQLHVTNDSDSYLAVIRVEQQINRLVSYSQHGNTPLYKTVHSGHSEVVKQLLRFKANVDIKKPCEL
jgi:ankyrin repeat protein